MMQKSVLIVDDEEDIRDFISEFLSGEGHQTHTAENGKEALEVLQSHSVDVVLSDVRMPVGDGVFLLKEIRKKNPDIPIVAMMTGFSDVSEDELLDSGANTVFLKPLSLQAVLEFVEAQT